MDIMVIGTGYVGLVTGTSLADAGNKVVCVDIDKNKIDNLKKGISPIYEDGLEALIKKNISAGNLQFSTSVNEEINKTSIIFIAVGTPQGDDGSAELKYVFEVAREIGSLINHKVIVINKSTVPVGTGTKVEEIIRSELVKRQLNIEFEVVSNPEFLKEGTALRDFQIPDRVVIGSENSWAIDTLKKLYRPYVSSEGQLVIMNRVSAEFTKYASNCFLATKITFANELSRLAEEIGANMDQVKVGMGFDTRIGHQFLNVGPGYGGSCFPKDVKALLHTAAQNNIDLKILKSVTNVNDEQKLVPVQKLNKHLKDLSGKKISLLGLAFKGDTDDMRESPALTVIDYLLQKKAVVKVFDPAAMENGKIIYKDKLEYCENAYQCVENAEALIIITEWKEFKSLNYEKIKKLMAYPLIIDARNLLNPGHMRESGFKYESIGRN